MTRDALMHRISVLLTTFEAQGEVVGLSIQFGKSRRRWDGEKFVSDPVLLPHQDWTLVSKLNLPRIGDEILEVWTKKVKYERPVTLRMATYNWSEGSMYLDTVPINVYRRPLNVPEE